MPITVKRIKPQIYLSIYTGNTNSTEILEVIHKRVALADEFQESSYVSIADLTEIGSFPLDLGTLRSIGEADSRNIRYLLVGTSLQMRVVLESFGVNVSSVIEFYKTLDEAVRRAHSLLEKP